MSKDYNDFGVTELDIKNAALGDFDDYEPSNHTQSFDGVGANNNGSEVHIKEQPAKQLIADDKVDCYRPDMSKDEADLDVELNSIPEQSRIEVFKNSVLADKLKDFYWKYIYKYLIKRIIIKRYVRSGYIGGERFIDLVAARDNGEEWAQEIISRMWESNDSTLIPRINIARISIYENAAMSGDRTAIIFYAKGLLWKGNEEEGVKWFYKLISQGDGDATYELASEYTEFGALGNNENEYDRLVKLAAEQGNAQAQYLHGLSCSMKKLQDESMLWYKMSADQNHIKGIVGYVGVLLNELRDIKSFSLGIAEMVENQYSCIKKYSIRNDDDCQKVIVDIYDECEERLLYAFNNAEYDEQGDVARAFSDLYLFSYHDIISSHPYRSAYYSFLSRFIYARDYNWSQMSFYNNTYKTQITIDVLKVWADTSCVFDDWLRENNIDD